MKKALLTLIAVAFFAAAGGQAFAMAHAKELMAACKDKKAGETVKLKSGKEYKCPEKK